MRSLVIFALVALAIAVVALAGWMLGRRAAPPAAGIAQTVQVEDLRVTVQLDQAVLGSRIVNVTVQDANDKPLDLSAVRLRFTMPEMDMGVIEAEAQPIGQGRFQAQGMFFTMVGRWTVDTTLVRDGRPPILATFAFPIAAPGEASGPLNPLTADVRTIQAGQQLYQANCAACHGAAGRGDGPLAAGLSPRPADFTQHMIPGKHTDGQVYLWIKDGFPGTAMPSWGQRLTEPQIWQLVTYLRTFGQHTTAATAASPKQPTAPALAVPPTGIPEVREPLPPLIFARQRNLWRSNGSGDHPQQLTNLGADHLAEHPTVSPDGARIAFITLAPAPITATLPISISVLYVMNADGSDLHVLWKPPRGLLALPTWTPDNQALYVGLSDILSDPMAPVPERLLEVVRVDLATGARRVMLEDARDPTIERDGKRMAYLHFDKQNAAFSLHVAAPDGSGDR
ncbi:MAG TPA: c-type cytochrome, partial [Roseiflexaceae bacterium]